MNKFLFLMIVALSSLQADCTPSQLLHTLKQKRVSLESNTTTLYARNYYNLKKGWNRLSTPKDGVDVEKTFLTKASVFIYDKRSKKWALYSPNAQEVHKSKEGLLWLHYIEPYKSFFLFAPKATRVSIVSQVPNAICQNIMKSGRFELISDSGTESGFTFNKNKSVGLRSRYFAHTRKYVYGDSRVLVMVPKLSKLSKNRELKKYGPAIPKMVLLFNEAYGGKRFFSYDYLEKGCFEGYFPSRRVPPMPTLEELH